MTLRVAVLNREHVSHSKAVLNRGVRPAPHAACTLPAPRPPRPRCASSSARAWRASPSARRPSGPECSSPRSRRSPWSQWSVVYICARRLAPGRGSGYLRGAARGRPHRGHP
eukprot:scaffold52525_cov75-Phaeocystis_antarctica.AAC.8